MLSPEAIARRKYFIGSSDAPILMEGDPVKVRRLWQEKIGDPDYVPVDLSGAWPVQLGIVTEPLNLDWFERKRGPVSRRGEEVIGKPAWMVTTLDGWSDDDRCPVECKHCGGRESMETLINRYSPQMHWQMLVTNAMQCAFSVILGANEPIVEFVPFNAEYAAILMHRAQEFWKCVEELRPPFDAPPVAAPVIALQEYDMAGSNAWAHFAAEWLANAEAKKIAEKAEKELKSLVPADGAVCHGHGVIIKRNRGGALSLRSGTNG